MKYRDFSKRKDKLKGRALSGLSKTECMLLVLDINTFKYLCYEKIKVKQEQKTQFVFDSIPALSQVGYSHNMLHKDIQYKFLDDEQNSLGQQIKFNRGNVILIEGCKNNVLFLLRKGECAIYKRNECLDAMGNPISKNERILTLSPNSIFGEESLCFPSRTKSYYSVEAVSAEVEILFVEHKHIRPDIKNLQQQPVA
jgi:hypothetical protein